MKTTVFAIAFNNAKKAAAEKAAKAAKKAAMAAFAAHKKGIENLNTMFKLGRFYGKDHGEIIAWVRCGMPETTTVATTFAFDLQLFANDNKLEAIKDFMAQKPNEALIASVDVNSADKGAIVAALIKLCRDNSVALSDVIIAYKKGNDNVTVCNGTRTQSASDVGEHKEEMLSIVKRARSSADGISQVFKLINGTYGVSKISLFNDYVADTVQIDGNAIDWYDDGEQAYCGTVAVLETDYIQDNQFKALEKLYDNTYNYQKASTQIQGDTFDRAFDPLTQFLIENGIKNCNDLNNCVVVINDDDMDEVRTIYGETFLSSSYYTEKDNYKVSYFVDRPEWSANPGAVFNAIRKQVNFIAAKKGIGYGIKGVALYTNYVYEKHTGKEAFKTFCHGTVVEITIGAVIDIDQAKKDCRPDDLLQLGIYAHGVGAFVETKTIEQMVSNVENINSIEGEICCAWKTQQIGPMGVFVSGEVTLASNIDLYSYLDETGQRVFDSESFRAEGIFAKKEELDLSKWDHCEFFVKVPKVRGIWVKDWFLQANPQLRNMLAHSAQQLGVKVYVVRKRYADD